MLVNIKERGGFIALILVNIKEIGGFIALKPPKSEKAV